MARDPLCDRLREAGDMTLTVLLQAVRYYAAEDNYNEDGAPTYTDLSPPEGWLGEEYDERVRLDEGKAARQALDDLERGWLEDESATASAPQHAAGDSRKRSA